MSRYLEGALYKCSIIICSPPTSSNYSQKPSVFPDEFGSLFSLAATTLTEFVLVGDFNVHVDTPDTLPFCFLNLLSSVQHVNFPTHIKNHTFDLLTLQSILASKSFTVD